MKSRPAILAIIALSQFCCTSLWFAGNATLPDLVVAYQLQPGSLALITSGVQFGFILGTLAFALLTISDRFSPSVVFFTCALLGAAFNAGIGWGHHSIFSLVFLRILTGVSLAGIYPVGMKIAADYFDTGLGKSLGFLVGALVVGTAFPHLLKGLTLTLPWKTILLTTSGIAIMGGFLILMFVPDGPYRKASSGFDWKAVFGIFRNPPLRSAAFGYFGHMWELYAFWAFTPVILATQNELHPNSTVNIPFWSFIIIGSGGLSCILGGYLSSIMGVRRVATYALTLSLGCCLIAPLMMKMGTTWMLVFMIFWGVVVIADSPMFSTLVAHSANPKTKGTALTLVNSIGFLITIFSIQLLSELTLHFHSAAVYMVLGFGPALGLLVMQQKRTLSR